MIRILIAVITIFAALPARAEVDIQELTTPTGINVWLVEDHSIPFVALELRFRGGGALDLPGKRGATTLMMALLEEGSADLDSRGFARAVEGLAASFSYDLGDDVASVSAKMLTENRDQAVALLRASLVDPHFNDADIERVRAQILSIIRSDLKDPREIASRADYRLGVDHRRGLFAAFLAGKVAGHAGYRNLSTRHRNAGRSGRLISEVCSKSLFPAPPIWIIVPP